MPIYEAYNFDGSFDIKTGAPSPNARKEFYRRRRPSSFQWNFFRCNGERPSGPVPEIAEWQWSGPDEYRDFRAGEIHKSVAKLSYRPT
jgi:hypothetical protein